MISTIEKAILILIIFVAGMLAASLYEGVSASKQEPTQVLSQGPVVRENPGDWIKEDGITVYSNRVILDLQDAEWARFTDTHSMEPVLSASANAIEIVPQSEAQIKIGDIVSYQSDFADGTIIHRVIGRGQDERGTYFTIKGDNNPEADPGKVRFSQIKRVVVAIIY